jgi:hypothetical protein
MPVRRMCAIIGDCGRSPNDAEDPVEDLDLTETLSREQHEAILQYYGVRSIYDLADDILEGYGIGLG